MSDFNELRNSLAPKIEGVRTGKITQVEGQAAVVQLDSGAMRKVYGSANVGARVTVKGDRILSTLPAGGEKTVFIA